MAFEIKGKTFMVSGGASGMGAIYPELFLDQGAKAIAILDIAEDKGKALVEQLSKKYPGQIFFFKCDVSIEDEITKVFNEVVEQFKQIDVIINNAGVMIDSPEIWRKASDINWQGVVSFTLKGVNHMSISEGGAGGTIVNIASVAAITRNPFLPIYGGSKAAVVHFHQNISMAPFSMTTGVRLLCMCFGPTDTPLLHNVDKRIYNPKQAAILANANYTIKHQTPEKAVEAAEYMIKNGQHGSIWLSINNKPAKDITAEIDEAYKGFEKLVVS